jgi:hypothetical protein
MSLERPVHAREAHVGDLIEVLEVNHHLLADDRGRDLLVARVHQLPLDLIDHPIELFLRHRALLAGAAEASEDLHPVEGFATIVALHHQGEHLLDPLVGGVATLAAFALAPTPRDLATGGESRVDDAVVEAAAERALHGRAGS